MCTTKWRSTRSKISRIAGLILGTLAFAGTSFGLAENAEWTLEKQRGDVSVYSREVPGSPYVEVKATVLITAPVSRISELMGNGEGCAAWRTKCKSSVVLERVSEHELYVHLVLDLPWPAADRDIVLHSKTAFDTQSKTATVSLTSDSSKLPPQDYVRAQSSGKFIIEKVSDEQVEFTYIMHTDLGGNLPAGSVNAGIADATYDDLKKLQELAEG